MKRFKSTIGILFLALGCAVAQRKDTPVIVIMADQLRYDVLGELTPNIESLRRDAVSFNRAYVASPICVPSRGSFFTGLYPNRSGSLINGWHSNDKPASKVKAGVPNLYNYFGQRWDSWHVGKQHFFTEEDIERSDNSKTRWITQKDYSKWVAARGASKPGGKEFKTRVPEMVGGEATHMRDYSIPVLGVYDDGLENFLDHYIADQSIEAIRQRDRRKPLLLNVMFLAPHPPFHIPEPYYSMVDEKEVELPGDVAVWYPGQSPLQMYNLTGFLGTRYSRDDWRAVWAKYLGLVKLLDDEVGRVIATLKEEGLYDKAIIVFTADHGEMLGGHSLWQKMCMYEPSARVPLIVKFPSDFKPSQRETDVPVSLVDVFPTLIDYTGLKSPGTMDGQSLLPLIQGDVSHRDPVFIQYDGNGSLSNFQRCVVEGDHKLIVDFFKNELFLELYDLKKDPLEADNLAFNSSHRQTVSRMLETLRGIMRNTGDRLDIPEDAYDIFRRLYPEPPGK